MRSLADRSEVFNGLPLSSISPFSMWNRNRHTRYNGRAPKEGRLGQNLLQQRHIGLVDHDGPCLYPSDLPTRNVLQQPEHRAAHPARLRKALSVGKDEVPHRLLVVEQIGVLGLPSE